MLRASQEHRIKLKKLAQADIDEVFIGHTNEAEHERLLNNQFMDAFLDRALQIDVPCITPPLVDR